MAAPSRTLQSGQRTEAHTHRHSAVAIANKDPNFDYSFRLRKEIEENGGVDHYGYEPVDASNHGGETFAGPVAKALQRRKTNRIIHHDTVLCKRPKEISRYFQERDDEKYNSQQQLVIHASKHRREELAKIRGSNATVVDQSSGLEKAFKQRVGPTESEKRIQDK
jgi:hypothetical protein